jgi:hypothetical protein
MPTDPRARSKFPSNIFMTVKKPAPLARPREGQRRVSLGFLNQMLS